MTNRPRQQTLQFDNGVAAKLEAILQRCGDRVKTGSVLFDARGEAHANRIAAADERQSRQAR